MNTRDWYFHQPVTEGEMDSAFDDVEKADLHSETDKGQYGILYGFTAGADGGGPSMNIQIEPGAAIDKDGHRIFSAGTILQDITNDTAGVPTAPAAGNRRWVSIFARFGRDLSDPRTDGLANPLFFKHDEALNSGDGTGTASPTGDVQLNVGKFLVVAGAEDSIGNPVPARPSLFSFTSILICDVLYTDGDTSFSLGQITTGRAEKYAFHFLGTLQDSTEYDGNLGTGENYALIMEAKGKYLTTDNFNRIYISNAGLVFTHNMRWVPELRKWFADNIGPMTKINLDGEGIKIYRMAAGAPFDDSTDLWDSVVYISANGTLGERLVLSADGNTYQDGPQTLVWGAHFTSDAISGLFGSGFTYQIPFSSAPSSVTIGTTLGSDLNVTGVSCSGLNRFGGAALVSPNAANTQTRAHRNIVAVL